MAKQSAGLLMFRRRETGVEVLLAHPGGPLWKDKDVWGIPKGEYEPGEDPLEAACREFEEETGFVAAGPYLGLGEITQRSGKRVRAWAFAGDCDAGAVVSNSFSMEWPPHSGIVIEVPELDRLAWFDPEAARNAMNPAQAALVDLLMEVLAA